MQFSQRGLGALNARQVTSRLCRCLCPVNLPASAPPKSILHEVFGYSAFRGAQAEIVDHVIAGGDALVPLRAGESLAWRLVG